RDARVAAAAVCPGFSTNESLDHRTILVFAFGTTDSLISFLSDTCAIFSKFNPTAISSMSARSPARIVVRSP
ncbi:MAG TPA: hypothetical protein PKY22_09700, partial [Accumulibacter sp.]|nr:hypothetical protein [Accumulibacter sp.]